MANYLEYNLCPKYLEFDNSIFEKKKKKKLKKKLFNQMPKNL